MKFETQADRFSYALGLSIASNLISTGIKTIEFNVFMEALIDAYTGQELKILPNDANQIIQDHLQTLQDNEGVINGKKGAEFLAMNSQKEGVITLDSGLQYTIITEGTGAKPKSTDKVRCHYHGTLIDGTVFDSSIVRDKPADFPVNGVISGWVEALQMMTLGSKWRLFIPPHLGYGDRGAGGSIGPNSTLIFDVELLEIL